MASYQVMKSTDGKIVSYKFICTLGRDDAGRKITRTMRVKVDDPRIAELTPAKCRKALNQIGEAWEEQMKADYVATGDRKDRSKLTLERFVNDFWYPEHVCDGSHSPSTVSFYRIISVDIVKYFGSKKQLRQLTPADVKRFTNYYRNDAVKNDGTKYSAYTVQHYFNTLRNICEVAVRYGYIASDPCRVLTAKEKPTRDKKPVEYLEIEDAKRYLSCLEKEPLFWRCLQTVLIRCGLRRGEVCGLQWGDFDPGEMTLTIRRNVTVDASAAEKYHIGQTKTGEIRTVPVPEPLCDMLLTFKEAQEQNYGTLLPTAFIFCRADDPYRPLYPTSPTRWQSDFVKRNHLPRVSPHDLRHTCATLQIRARVDLATVQANLGHKSPRTTIDFYAGVSEEVKRQAVDSVDRLLNSKKEPV